MYHGVVRCGVSDASSIGNEVNLVNLIGEWGKVLKG